MKVFGISLLTILVVIAAFYVGRRTTVLTGVWTPFTG